MKKWLAMIGCCLSLSLVNTTWAAQPVASGLQQSEPISQHNLEKFGNAFEAVRQLHADKFTDEEIIERAVQGMLEGLDPHSTYLDEKELSALREMTRGEFSGLGIEVTKDKSGAVKVVSPIDGSPAYKAGIKAGDLIVQTDGQNIANMGLNAAINKMRGKPGTKITLTILRKGEQKPLRITVTRASIKVASVKQRVIDQHYGVIRISSFQSDTGPGVRNAVKKLREETKGDLRGIVLDLRNNPGGLLEQSIEVADVFLAANELGHGKKIVYTKGRLKEMSTQGKAMTPDMTKGVPVVVLINEGSASASEIVAGALQDHRRAIIMGKRSFGKGSVQTVFPLTDKKKTAIKLTTARYYTPSGRTIQAKGIEPDIQVEALNIPESANPQNPVFVSESSYGSHIKAKDDNSLVTEEKADMQSLNGLLQSQQAPTKKQLVHEDYQLHQAINLLKGMRAANLLSGR